MSENGKKKVDRCLPKQTSSNVLFRPQPKDIQCICSALLILLLDTMSTSVFVQNEQWKRMDSFKAQGQFQNMKEDNCKWGTQRSTWRCCLFPKDSGSAALVTEELLRARSSFTVICSANKLALHIFSVCGSAGSPPVQSSTQWDEVAETAAMEGDTTQRRYSAGSTDEGSLYCGRMCVRDKTSMQGKHNGRWETIRCAEDCVHCYTRTKS